MSLNLTLTEESEDGCAIRFDLIQTPTAITIECLNSLNIKEFYEKFVKDRHPETAEDHIKKLNDFLDCNKNATWSYI
jgi:hypothetical protein